MKLPIFSSWLPRGRIVYYDMNYLIIIGSDGVTRCGMYCAASCLIDMINTEQEVDVFRVVQHIRATRPQFIKSQVSSALRAMYLNVGNIDLHTLHENNLS